jgi:hypothetical protein
MQAVREDVEIVWLDSDQARGNTLTNESDAKLRGESSSKSIIPNLC